MISKITLYVEDDEVTDNANAADAEFSKSAMEAANARKFASNRPALSARLPSHRASKMPVCQ